MAKVIGYIPPKSEEKPEALNKAEEKKPETVPKSEEKPKK